MNLAKLVSIGIALLLIQACSHPIDIEGEGDVTTTTENGGTGTRGCTWEESQPEPALDRCSKNYILGLKYDAETKQWVPDDYKEAYTAVPRPGWMFHSWENCTFDGVPLLSTANGTVCTFNVPSANVRAAWGADLNPLKAVFTKIQMCGNGTLESPETCDDGNVESGDGCSNVCVIETGCPCVDELGGFDAFVSNYSRFQSFWEEDQPYRGHTCTTDEYTTGSVDAPSPGFYATFTIHRDNPGTEIDYQSCLVQIGYPIYVRIPSSPSPARRINDDQLIACQGQMSRLHAIDPLKACGG